MKLGIDLDGVCADFNAGWAQRHNEWFGTNLDPLGFDFEDWPHNILTSSRFDTEEEFWGWVDAVPGFWMNLEPIPGAMGGLWQLQQAGHELHFITSRKDTSDIRAQSSVWLMEHAPNDLPAGTEALHMVNGKSKSIIDCQVYIDDSPKEILRLRAENRVVVRFDQPWNSTRDGGITAKNWRDVVRIIEVMS